MDTLSDRINQGKELTQSEQDSLYDLLTKGCRERTKNIIARKVSYVPDIACFSQYARIYFEDGEASYCAGQSYTEELARLRKLLINS